LLSASVTHQLQIQVISTFTRHSKIDSSDMSCAAQTV